MPTYLCHGFRWYRKNIRIFVMVNDLEDAAPDWIISPDSSSSILNVFLDLYEFLPELDSESEPATSSAPAAPAPDSDGNHKLKADISVDEDLTVPPSRVIASEDKVLCNTWSPVKLLEEYDSRETHAAARPYAFVADHVVRIDLHADVMLEMSKYESVVHQEGGRPWLKQLMEQLQPEAEIKWYIVTCEDDERPV